MKEKVPAQGRLVFILTLMLVALGDAKFNRAELLACRAHEGAH